MSEPESSSNFMRDLLMDPRLAQGADHMITLPPEDPRIGWAP
jgi:hypothetical protein